nr:cytochrome P450 CYP749A22-like [Malus domestica]
MRNSIREIIKKREEKAAIGDEESFGGDYLGLVLKAHHDSNDEKRISVDEMVDECKTIYFAGHETTNTVLAWTVFFWHSTLIVKRKQERRKVDREVRLEKLIVPANVEVVFPTLAIQHEPEFWGQDVQLFKPDRFVQGVAKATNNSIAAFLPFATGP